MQIQIVGASVNAAVMAYHLAEVGHTLYWDIGDSAIEHELQSGKVVFNDYDLSMGLRAHSQSKQIEFKSKSSNNLSPEHSARAITAIILAFTEEQYDNFVRRENKLPVSSIIINYSHLGLGKTETLKKQCPDTPIVYIPDFLQEGNLIGSFLTQKLIVGCAAQDEASKFLVQEIFRPLFPLATQYNFMSIRAAEFTKLSISGFLAAKISFMNDLSNAAEALGVDIEEVRIAMSTDARIGEQYLFAGCGFGGFNLTRDVLTLKEVVQHTGNTNGLLEKIWDINEYQKEIVFRKLWKLFDGQLQEKVIAFWGASFKPNTASLAQAPICNILKACWAQGAVTRVHDPRALNNLRVLYPNQPLLQCESEQYRVADGADALCLITEWKQYWSPDFARLRQNMRQCNLIDGRNIYNPTYVKQQGFHYIGIGR